jgi:PAS domain S-box-containing protein
MPTLVDLLFQTVDGAFAVDPDERITFWNPACEQLFGIPAREVLGRPCSAVLRGTDPWGKPLCKQGCNVARLACGGTPPETFPLRVRDARGKDLRLSVSIVLVPSKWKDLWTVVHLLHRGEVPEVLDVVERSFSRKPRARQAGPRDADRSSPATLASLTPRELEILRLLSEGLPSSVLSQRLSISLTTVRNHIQHLLSKLKVHSQMEAVAYAYRHNLL